MPDALPWRFALFVEAVETWIQLEQPGDDLRLIVLNWVMNRHDDPHRGVHREPGFPDLWFGVIPSTSHNGQVVTCAYFIDEQARVVRASAIASLSPPFR